LDDRGLITGRGRKYFWTPPHPDWLWSASNLLSNGYRGHFPRRKVAGEWSWPPTSISCRS